jgi:hypothetical protein
MTYDAATTIVETFLDYEVTIVVGHLTLPIDRLHFIEELEWSMTHDDLGITIEVDHTRSELIVKGTL